MASLDTIAPLQILKTKGSQTPLSNQSKVAALVEYTKSLLDAEDQQHAQVAEAANGQVSHGLSPGATVDLSKRSMHELPVEVIELMRDRVERYGGHLELFLSRLVDHGTDLPSLTTLKSRFLLKSSNVTDCATSMFE